jgi:hypothetical protein
MKYAGNRYHVVKVVIPVKVGSLEFRDVSRGARERVGISPHQLRRGQHVFVLTGTPEDLKEV